MISSFFRNWFSHPGKQPVTVTVKPQPAGSANTSKDGERCSQAETNLIHNLICPDCLSKNRLFSGPTGGLSVNIACGDCGSEFNIMGPFGVDRISTKGKPDIARLKSAYRIVLDEKANHK